LKHRGTEEVRIEILVFLRKISGRFRNHFCQIQKRRPDLDPSVPSFLSVSGFEEGQIKFSLQNIEQKSCYLS
jgi:hypothetical protein